MPTQDISQRIYHSAAVILESCKEIKGAVDGYLGSSEKPDIWYHLLRILFYADDLVQVVDPDKTQDDYFEVPDSARGNRVERWTFRHSRRDPAWDFTAWYGEKASRVKTGALWLIRDWMATPEDSIIPSPRPPIPSMTHKQLLYEGIRLGYAEVHGNALKIFNEVHTDGLVVEPDPEG